MFKKISILFLIISIIIIISTKFINLNFCKNYLIEIAHKHGLELKITQDLKINILPDLSVVTGPIELYDLENKRQKLIKAENLNFRVKLLPLFLGKISSQEIYLKSPILYLNQSTIKNLQNRFASKITDPENGEKNIIKKEKITFSFEKLIIEDAELFYNDDKGSTYFSEIFLKTDFEKNTNFAASVKYRDNEHNIKLKGNIENVKQLMNDESSLVNLIISLKNSEFKLNFSIKNAKDELILSNCDFNSAADFFKGKLYFKKQTGKFIFDGMMNLTSIIIPDHFSFFMNQDKKNDDKEIFNKEALKLNFIDKLQGKLDFVIGDIQIYNVNLNQLKGNININNGKARIDLNQGHIAQGNISLKLEISSLNNHYQFDSELSNISVEDILKDILGKSEINGSGNMKIHLIGSGFSPYLLAKNSIGDISIFIKDGQLNNSKFISNKFMDISKLKFDNINLNWQIKNAIAYDSGSEILSKLVDLGFKGNINIIENIIDYNIFPKKIYYSNIMNKYLVINIKGPLNNPKINYGTKQVLNQVTKDLTKDFTKKILSKDKIIDKTIGNFLEQIL